MANVQVGRPIINELWHRGCENTHSWHAWIISDSIHVDFGYWFVCSFDDADMTIFFHDLHLAFKSILEIWSSCCIHVLARGVWAAITIEGTYVFSVGIFSEFTFLSRIIFGQILWNGCCWLIWRIKSVVIFGRFICGILLVLVLYWSSRFIYQIWYFGNAWNIRCPVFRWSSLILVIAWSVNLYSFIHSGVRLWIWCGAKCILSSFIILRVSADVWIIVFLNLLTRAYRAIVNLSP